VTGRAWIERIQSGRDAGAFAAKLPEEAAELYRTFSAKERDGFDFYREWDALR
jgi:hypothetical protein